MSAPAPSLAGMHAIVTGGGTGVGAATALALAQRGANVLVNYRRSADAAEAVCAECRALGADAIAMQADVAQDADCQALARAAVQRWGRIDLLVNSAGVTQFTPLDQLEALDAAAFVDIYQVNAVGPFQMARAVAPHMQAGAAMASVSSLAAQSGQGSSIPYAMSKAALNALTLSLARALAPRVRVNAVMPGMIEGRWMREGLGDTQYEVVRQNFSRNALLEKVCTPQDIASAIVWLLDPACIMTGQCVTVDAGFTLGRPPRVAPST